MTTEEQIRAAPETREAEPRQTATGPVQSDPVQQTDDVSPIVGPVEARQGVISGRVVTVLGVSLTLVILGMVIAYMVV
jgi:hypothetical protein